ncbi:MAG: hypothetical protein A2W99_04050 [Bacteroidetes bacterium GWF2_33_16]|nr:MAG: hypothetical protein A2X00_07265 [Bacteroidetes bacterium GWE2_32_14]OFY02965.1 MAG: hypothetical protein A2W99_04050 [Bacteroidetes bacterium GWF2_33_16]
MKKLLLSFLFGLFVVFAFSQSISSSVVATAGGYSEAGGLSLSWTLGELATETFTTTNLILTQGFQQGYFEITSIDEPLSKSIDLKVYPNPAIDFINILIEDIDVKLVRIELYNLEGKLISNEQWENTGTPYQFQLSSFSSSQYILRIVDDKNNRVKSFKIVKR